MMLFIAAFALLLVKLQPAVCQQYQLIREYNTSNIFEEFSFFTDPDPTGGFVQYVSFETAASTGLIGNSSDLVYLGVDNTNVYTPGGLGRPSVRLQSKLTFTEGLFVIDLTHIPVGCGTWPAFWTTGLGDWPADGEIDIIENVNDARSNNAALHAAGDCSVVETANQTGIWKSVDCNIEHDENQGCGTTFTEPFNYGAEFNANGGGVYAAEWTSQAVRIWFFPPSSVPGSLLYGNNIPDTTSFGTPSVLFEGPCSGSFSDKFFNHSIIIDTTFCGGWAGSTFGHGTSSCLVSKGMSPIDSCISYVASNPQAFEEAYWGIKSLRVWEKVQGYTPGIFMDQTVDGSPTLTVDILMPEDTGEPVPVGVLPLTNGVLVIEEGSNWTVTASTSASRDAVSPIPTNVSPLTGGVLTLGDEANRTMSPKPHKPFPILIDPGIGDGTFSDTFQPSPSDYPVFEEETPSEPTFKPFGTVPDYPLSDPWPTIDHSGPIPPHMSQDPALVPTTSDLLGVDALGQLPETTSRLFTPVVSILEEVDMNTKVSGPFFTSALDKQDTGQAVSGLLGLLDPETKKYLLGLLNTSEAGLGKTEANRQEVQPANVSNTHRGDVATPTVSISWPKLANTATAPSITGDGQVLPVAPEVLATSPLNSTDTAQAVDGLFHYLDEATEKQFLALLAPYVGPQANPLVERHTADSWETIADALSEDTNAKFDDIITQVGRLGEIGIASISSGLLNGLLSREFLPISSTVGVISEIEKAKLLQWFTGGKGTRLYAKSLATLAVAGDASFQARVQDVINAAQVYSNATKEERDGGQVAAVASAVKEAFDSLSGNSLHKRNGQPPLSIHDIHNFIDDFHALQPPVDSLNPEEFNDLAAVWTNPTINPRIKKGKLFQALEGKLSLADRFINQFFLFVTDAILSLSPEDQIDIIKKLLEDPVEINKRDDSASRLTDENVKSFLEQQLFSICPRLGNLDTFSIELINDLEHSDTSMETSLTRFKGRINAYTTQLQDCLEQVTGYARKLKEFVEHNIGGEAAVTLKLRQRQPLPTYTATNVEKIFSQFKTDGLRGVNSVDEGGLASLLTLLLSLKKHAILSSDSTTSSLNEDPIPSMDELVLSTDNDEAIIGVRSRRQLQPVTPEHIDKIFSQFKSTSVPKVEESLISIVLSTLFNLTRTIPSSSQNENEKRQTSFGPLEVTHDVPSELGPQEPANFAPWWHPTSQYDKYLFGTLSKEQREDLHDLVAQGTSCALGTAGVDCLGKVSEAYKKAVGSIGVGGGMDDISGYEEKAGSGSGTKPLGGLPGTQASKPLEAPFSGSSGLGNEASPFEKSSGDVTGVGVTSPAGITVLDENFVPHTIPNPPKGLVDPGNNFVPHTPPNPHYFELIHPQLVDSLRSLGLQAVYEKPAPNGVPEAYIKKVGSYLEGELEPLDGHAKEGISTLFGPCPDSKLHHCDEAALDSDSAQQLPSKLLSRLHPRAHTPLVPVAPVTDRPNDEDEGISVSLNIELDIPDYEGSHDWNLDDLEENPLGDTSPVKLSESEPLDSLGQSDTLIPDLVEEGNDSTEGETDRRSSQPELSLLPDVEYEDGGSTPGTEPANLNSVDVYDIDDFIRDLFPGHEVPTHADENARSWDDVRLVGEETGNRFLDAIKLTPGEMTEVWASDGSDN